MGRINTYNKGRRFEQETCKLLKEYTKVQWNRVPNSGGLSKFSMMNQFQGDCYSEHPEWNDVVVECKSWGSISFNEPYSDKSKFWKAIFQSKKESKENRWLLLIKLNNLGVFALSDDAKLLSKIGFGNENELRLNSYYTILKIK